MHDNHIPDNIEIPYGFCHCGCGRKTSIAEYTSETRGCVAGEPLRFLGGHSNALPSMFRRRGDSKQCVSCDKIQPISNFAKSLGASDGLRSQCRMCVKGSVSNAARKRLSDALIERRKRNPQDARIVFHNCRSRKLGSSGRVSVQEWEAILVKFDRKCVRCGSASNIEIDHIVPISKGGEHSPSNIQPLCRRCNRYKYTRTIDYRP